MRYFVTLPSQEELAVDIVHLPTGGTRIEIDGKPIDADAEQADGAWNIRVGDRIFDLWLDDEPPNVRFVASGSRLEARIESERSRMHEGSHDAARGGGQVTAPMPGRVVKVLASVGDVISAGTPVIVVEAMKMENELCADGDGTVKEICAEPGQNVEGGAVLLRLE